MLVFSAWLAGVVLVTLVYAVLVEYLIHRFLDHRRFKIFGWHPALLAHLYQTHSMEHHQDYGDKESYVYSGCPKPMDWIDVPLLLCSHMIVIPLYVGAWFLVGWPGIAACAAYVFFHYLFLYSTVHYAMHHPGSAGLHRAPIARGMNFHHWLHHRHQHKNYAFTIPIFDYVFRTKWMGTDAEKQEFAQEILSRTPKPLPVREVAKV